MYIVSLTKHIGNKLLIMIIPIHGKCEIAIDPDKKNTQINQENP